MSKTTAHDRVLTLAAVVGSASLVYLAVLQSRNAGPATRSTVTEYVVGDRFPDIPGAGLDLAPATLVLWLRTSCPYCTESMDLYRRIASYPKRTRVVVMGMEPEEALSQYLREHGVSVHRVISVKRGTIRLFRTPTAVLVGSDRTIRRVWIGMLRNDSEERELFRALE